MKYLGGKYKIRKDLWKFFNGKLEREQPFVDLFCGGCWVTMGIDNNRLIIANDKHKYLMDMWCGMQSGYTFPEQVTKEEYDYIRDNKDADPVLTGFVGFNCSYGGKWFGGYARDRKGNRNFAREGKDSLVKKMEKMKDVQFLCLDYLDVNIPVGAVVYCDIPYNSKTTYCKKEVGDFDRDEFFKWCIDNKDRYSIYISEYKEHITKDIESQFEIVWEKKSSKGNLKTDSNLSDRGTTEVLITPRLITI